MARAFTVLRGVLYSAAFVWLWTWLALSVRAYDHVFGALPPWISVLGYPIAAGGAVLALACIATFVTRGRGTPAPFDAPRELVAIGPYRYVRNPMYVGACALLLGAGLVVGSPSIVLLSVAFLAIAHVFVVVYEEPALAETFGDSYAAYRDSVHRWRIARPRS